MSSTWQMLIFVLVVFNNVQSRTPTAGKNLDQIRGFRRIWTQQVDRGFDKKPCNPDH